jgi:type II secretory pathway pseudopilin PulG
MKINWLLKLLKNNQNSSNKGVTLTELLVAASISIVVIGAAGYALMESQKSSRAASTQVDARTEVNRALTFITDEIKGARSIVDTSAGYAPSGFSPPSDKNVRVVLALQVPHPTNTDSNLDVIYYVRDNESPWIGPKVIYRWGPNFDAKGGYSAATVDTPASWQHEAVIDQIPNELVSTATCLSSDIKITASDAGFGVCIDSTKRSANILISRVKDQKDWESEDASAKANSIYTGELKAFSRGDSKNTGYSGEMSLTTTTATGSSTTTQASKTIRITQLGSSYACTSTGSAVIITEVTVSKKDNSSTPVIYEWKNENGGYAVKKSNNSAVKDIPFDRDNETATYTSRYVPTSTKCAMNPDQSITVDSTIASTDPTSTSKVQKLENDRVLSTSNTADKRMMESKYVYGSPSPAQKTVVDLLKERNLYDTSTNKIKIDPESGYTKFIYAFEMGPSSTETGFHEAGFDYQDNLIYVSEAD